MMRNLYILLFFVLFAVSTNAQSEYNSNFLSNNPVFGGDVVENLKVYPNPAKSYFSVTENEAVLTIELYNIVGRKLNSYEMKAGMKYDISDLQKGMYLVRLIDHNDKVVKTLRLQKE